MDSVGSFGRTVADAVVVLDAIAGEDSEDHFTKVPERWQSASYTASLSTREALQGAKFGLPIKRCWDLCPSDCKEVAGKVLDAIKEAGGTIIDIDIPSIEERVGPSGKWNWEHGRPDQSEWTVAKVDAYNNVNAYLSSLSATSIKTIEDVAAFNQNNDGTEGANPNVVPAFQSGQDKFLEIIESKGTKDETYQAALGHIHKQTRENGIDAALTYKDPDTGKTIQLDGILFCDRKGIGQQYAAQAGYPIVCIPIGLDSQGLPVSLSIQHSAWQEEKLVKWASAIEDLWRWKAGPRPMPQYNNMGAKNIPIEKAA
ncbi:amidase signature enzyme [Myriangium duriaei CBS 260.36]|uniref:Amidase signature enzyme n=1 Tax=Myriangium duriaei CBS 260.36 TaxID=1168546 RepID=A0A9P4MGZ9_9PEZI|nr:amidase signature enzyme [Myriangium duriaei CBS 260.36]